MLQPTHAPTNTYPLEENDIGGSTGGIPGTGDSQIGNTGGTTGVTGAVVPPPPPSPWTNMAVNTQQGYNTLRSAAGQPWGQSGGQYNDLLTQGFTSDQIRDSAGQMYGAPSNENFNQMVTHAGMTSPTGRPLAGSAQFYQPVFQPQYQNYNMGNPMSVSQYGQMGNFNPFMMQGRFNPYTNTMQSPFSFQSQPQPQMSMGMQTPFSSGMSRPAPQRVSSGPAQAIVSRSAGLRGTPNVMRRAEGGITSLMDVE